MRSIGFLSELRGERLGCRPRRVPEEIVGPCFMLYGGNSNPPPPESQRSWAPLDIYTRSIVYGMGLPGFATDESTGRQDK